MRRSWTVVCALILAAALSACSEDPEVAKKRLVMEGDSFMAAKKYSEAIISYRNAVRVDDKFGEGRLKLAKAFLSAGDNGNALRESVRAADLLPNDIDAQLTAGTLLMLARQYPEARARALAVLAKNPKNPQGLVLLGNSLAGMKDLDGAIEQVEQAIEQAPELVLSYANLGALQIAKGDRDAAEAAFRRAVEAEPNSIQAHGSLANFLWATDRLPEAEAEFKAALRLEPNSVTLNRALATFYLGQNKPDEAEPFLKTYADKGGVTAQVVLADHYVRTRRVQEASAILTRAAQDPEGFSLATVRLAALDFAQNRSQQAYEKLDSVLARNAKDPGALAAKIRIELLERKVQEALANAKTLVEVNPRSSSGQYMLGLAYEATGAVDDAMKAYQQALAVAPSTVPIQGKLAGLHIVKGNAREALLLSQQVVRARPRSADAHLLYARALTLSGELTTAERELTALEKAVPKSGDVQLALGLMYEARKDNRGARRAFSRALELLPESEVAIAGLSAADLADNNPSAALTRIEAQLAKKPNDVTLVMMSGMAYQATRDYPRAEAAYRKLLTLAPNNIEAYSRLGSIYLAQRRLDDARKSFEEMAQRPGEQAVAETMLGTIQMAQGRGDEARKHFERALQLDPRAAVAANNLAWEYASNAGNLDVALQLAQTAKAELPQNSSVTDTLGWVYYKKGLSQLAVTTFQEALSQNQNSANIHYHLGLALLQNGQKAEARTTLLDLLRKYPTYAQAGEVRTTIDSIVSE